MPTPSENQSTQTLQDSADRAHKAKMYRFVKKTQRAKRKAPEPTVPEEEEEKLESEEEEEKPQAAFSDSRSVSPTPTMDTVDLETRSNTVNSFEETKEEALFRVVPGALMRLAELVAGFTHMKLFQLVRQPVIYSDDHLVLPNTLEDWERYMTPPFSSNLQHVMEEIKAVGSPRARKLSLYELASTEYVRNMFATWIGAKILLSRFLGMRDWPRRETMGQVNSVIQQAGFFFQTY